MSRTAKGLAVVAMAGALAVAAGMAAWSQPAAKKPAQTTPASARPPEQAAD